MKKLILLIVVSCAMLLLLCSCSDCEHQWSSATCQSPSLCRLCGQTSGTAVAHTYADATCTKAQECISCGITKGEPLGHTLTKATCFRPATCTVCNTEIGDLAEHSFTQASCTETAHCTVCFAKAESVGGHNWTEPSCSSPKTCTSCGATEGEALTHIWIGEICTTKKICELCGIEGEANEHNWAEATCYLPKTCTKCNQTQGKPNGHSWVGTTCLEPKICSVCNETTNEDLPHRWVFTGCLSLRYCSVCSTKEDTVPGHNIVEASCESPTHCTECSLKQGEALGHNWVEANCTRPTTCTRCNSTVGEPLEHTWVFAETVSPSCKEGAHIYRCGCGTERSEVIYPIRDHHVCDEDGLCSVCNTQYDTGKMTLTAISVEADTEVLKQGIFRSSETTAKIYKPITSEDLGMPVVDLNGDISSLTSKGIVVSVPFSYSDGELTFDCTAELNVQGASSANYPKKNYSVKLYEADGGKNKVELKDGWGKQFKYCLKANWVDYSQARNVVSGQLYGDVIDARDVADELSDLANGGAIDGFPVVVFNNGKFLGLYTMNIPKDKWMFDMKDSDEKNQAIVMGEHWGNSVAMRELISYDASNPNWTGSSNWELEYASNEDSTADNSTVWVAESLNNLINFVMNNDGEDFKNGIHQYADVDKCIDSMLYTFFICADDNISKNILWVTYDGTHWFSSVYDMDGTWGMQWNGNLSFTNGNTHLINVLASHNNSRYNLLWEKLYLNFYDEIVERYWELRGSALSIENITYRFEAFFNQIPDYVRTAEKQKWSSAPDKTDDHLKQILDFAKVRIEKMDAILTRK